MNITEGEVFRNTTDGTDFIVKKIVKDMVVLESQDGKRQILTGVSTLISTPFYQKREKRHQTRHPTATAATGIDKEGNKIIMESGER